MSTSWLADDPLTAIVTGASSGIGRSVAQRLVARGGRVALWARRTHELNVLADELGENALAVTCDVSDPEAVDRAATLTQERLGLVNALVNVAGISDPKPLSELDDETWAQTLDINLNGTFFPSQAVALRLREQRARGSIVNIGSELSSFGMPGYVAYCASKFGVIGITKALAAELAPAVRVNALCPGPVDTPMLASELALAEDPAVARDEELSRPPLRRIANPDEVADAAVWLLCDATFATGALVPLDGGTTAV